MLRLQIALKNLPIKIPVFSQKNSYFFYLPFFQIFPLRFAVYCAGFGCCGRYPITAGLARQKNLYRRQPETQPFCHDLGTYPTADWLGFVLFKSAGTVFQKCHEKPGNEVLDIRAHHDDDPRHHLNYRWLFPLKKGFVARKKAP